MASKTSSSWWLTLTTPAEGTGARDLVERRITEQTELARRAIGEAPLSDDARAALDALAVAATSRSA